jgi:hypothetical protein
LPFICNENGILNRLSLGREDHPAVSYELVGVELGDDGNLPIIINGTKSPDVLVGQSEGVMIALEECLSAAVGVQVKELWLIFTLKRSQEYSRAVF